MALNPVVLPCGTPIDDLVAQVAGDASPEALAHQRTCAHCQAALAAVREAWIAFEDSTRAPVRPPSDLADRIAGQIRMLASPRGSVPVLVGPRGRTSLATSVLGQLARRAALAIGGVALATTLTADPDPDHPGSVSVSLRLVVAFGPSIDALAAAVRAEVISQLARQAGTRVSRVDIAVEDLVVA
jgi:hypothetical protein